MFNYLKMLLKRPYLSTPIIEGYEVSSYVVYNNLLHYIVKYSDSEVEHTKFYILKDNDFILHNENEEPAHIKSKNYSNSYNERLYLRFFYYKNGKLHRDGDKPAIYATYLNDGEFEEYNPRIEHYYQNGNLHREGDKPASYCYDDEVEEMVTKYYKHGYLHREGDKPAIYSDRGYLKEYYQEGKLHRDNGLPARITYSCLAKDYHFRLQMLARARVAELSKYIHSNDSEKKNKARKEQLKRKNSFLKNYQVEEFYLKGVLVNQETAKMGSKLKEF